MTTVLSSHGRGSALDLAALGPRPTFASAGASDDAKVIAESLHALRAGTPSLLTGARALARAQPATSMEERLYDSLATAKVMTAQVAMYLDRPWRDRLFAQLDSLLDAAEWHEEDVPINGASFA